MAKTTTAKKEKTTTPAAASVFKNLVKASAKGIGSLSIKNIREVRATFVNQQTGISTGCLALDVYLNGGIPNGRFIYIFGKSGSCKTSLCFSICGMALAAGRPVLYADSEESCDPLWMSRFGVDVDNELFQYSRSVVGEDQFTFIRRVLHEWPDNVPGPVIMIDSLKMMSPKEFIIDEKNMIGAHARMLSRELAATRALVAAKGGILVTVNQVRTNVMQMFGDKTSHPGGDACIFYPDVHIRMSAIGRNAKKFNESGGFIAKTKVEKSKYCVPFTECEIRMTPTGFDLDHDTIQYLVTTGQGEFSKGELSVNWEQISELQKFKGAAIGTKLAELRPLCFEQVNSGKTWELLKNQGIDRSVIKEIADPDMAVDPTAVSDDDEVGSY